MAEERLALADLVGGHTFTEIGSLRLALFLRHRVFPSPGLSPFPRGATGAAQTILLTTSASRTPASAEYNRVLEEEGGAAAVKRARWSPELPKAVGAEPLKH